MRARIILARDYPDSPPPSPLTTNLVTLGILRHGLLSVVVLASTRRRDTARRLQELY